MHSTVFGVKQRHVHRSAPNPSPSSEAGLREYHSLRLFCYLRALCIERVNKVLKISIAVHDLKLSTDWVMGQAFELQNTSRMLEISQPRYPRNSDKLKCKCQGKSD